MSILFESGRLGEIEIKNRIVMSPLTRCRTDHKTRTPDHLTVKYYAQRASAGLIITEATSVDPMGVGYAGTPGIWSEEQVAGWKKVVDAVHAKGAKIVLQLWHVGRLSDPMFLDGKSPVAPSAIAAHGNISLVRPPKPYPVPRALEIEEIPAIVEAFRKGAANAKKAGFDGVDIHGANNYLPDQFMQDTMNHRTDRYGGSIENRCRFPLEVVDAVLKEWSPGRVGYHLSPRGYVKHGEDDSVRENTFVYLATELGKRKLGFIFSRETKGENYLGDKIRKAFGGDYIANEKLDRSTAEFLISHGEATACAFGVNFIGNPDLPRCFKENLPLTPADFSTVYAQGETGYTDYPEAK